MPYIKSTLVGFFTVVVTTIAYVLMRRCFLRRHALPPGTEVGFDLRSLITSPLYWLIAIAAFALGFYWELRRAR